jgi:HEPN domain-containing protein
MQRRVQIAGILRVLLNTRFASKISLEYLLSEMLARPLIEKANFNDLDKLSKQIENKLTSVIDEIIEDIKRSKLT